MTLFFEIILPDKWKPTARRIWEYRLWFVIAFIIAMLGFAIVAGLCARETLANLGKLKT